MRHSVTVNRQDSIFEEVSPPLSYSACRTSKGVSIRRWVARAQSKTQPSMLRASNSQRSTGPITAEPRTTSWSTRTTSPQSTSLRRWTRHQPTPSSMKCGRKKAARMRGVHCPSFHTSRCQQPCHRSSKAGALSPVSSKVRATKYPKRSRTTV